jgi:hypothetical protein
MAPHQQIPSNPPRPHRVEAIVLSIEMLITACMATGWSGCCTGQGPAGLQPTTPAEAALRGLFRSRSRTQISSTSAPLAAARTRERLGPDRDPAARRGAYPDGSSGKPRMRASTTSGISTRSQAWSLERPSWMPTARSAGSGARRGRDMVHGDPAPRPSAVSAVGCLLAIGRQSSPSRRRRMWRDLPRQGNGPLRSLDEGSRS